MMTVDELLNKVAKRRKKRLRLEALTKENEAAIEKLLERRVALATELERI